MFHWYADYLICSFWFHTETNIGLTKKVNKMKIFVPTINDSRPSTVITKMCVLDAAGLLDPHDKL